MIYKEQIKSLAKENNLTIKKLSENLEFPVIKFRSFLNSDLADFELLEMIYSELGYKFIPEIILPDGRIVTGDTPKELVLNMIYARKTSITKISRVINKSRQAINYKINYSPFYFKDLIEYAEALGCVFSVRIVGL